MLLGTLAIALLAIACWCFFWTGFRLARSNDTRDEARLALVNANERVWLLKALREGDLAKVESTLRDRGLGDLGVYDELSRDRTGPSYWQLELDPVFAIRLLSVELKGPLEAQRPINVEAVRNSLNDTGVSK